VQAFKRLVGHLGAPSAFDSGLLFCLLGLTVVALWR
jgi:hypothetical protein